MARGINKVTLVGNLGQDPEVKHLSNGNAVANFTIATSENWKDKQTGESKERTEWHRIVIYGKLAEIAGEYAKKGSQVYIEGKLQTRKWQDRYTTEIVISSLGGELQILGNRLHTTEDDNLKKTVEPAPDLPPAPPTDFDDDIPF